MREISRVAVIALSIVACRKTPETERGRSTDQLVATAESFVEAFYSYDPDALRPVLSAADESAASILFYQGWGESGNYEVVNRAPCKLDDDATISCSITAKDDLIGALDNDFNVTDAFHLTFSNGQIVSFTASSNNPQEFYDAEEWGEKNRPELVGKSCQRSKDRPATPGDCVREYVRGFSEFVEAGGLSEDFSMSE